MALLSELASPETSEEIEQRILDLCELAGLPTTSWSATSWVRTVISSVSPIISDAWFTVAQIANGSVLGLSTGRWLDRHASSNYDEVRTDPIFTVGTFKLTDNGGGPHTITVGAVVVASESGLRYVNTTGGTLALNSDLDVTFRAEAVGGEYNLPNDTTLALVTSLPTVTVTNPEVGTTGTWISTQGADVEDDDSLTARLPGKWATLSTGSPRAAYLYWALSTVGVTRAKVDDGNPDGPNTVRVYVDASGSVAALQATLDSKAPIGTRATAAAAVVTAVDVPGTVTVDAAYAATAAGAIDSALTQLASEIDIGGLVILAELIERVMGPDGVVDFQIGSSWVGSPNYQLPANAIPQFTTSLVIVTQ